MTSFQAFIFEPSNFFRAARRQWKVAYLNLMLMSILLGIAQAAILIPKEKFDIFAALSGAAVVTTILVIFSFLSTLGILVIMNHYHKTDWFGRISAVCAYATTIIPFYGIILSVLRLLDFVVSPAKSTPTFYILSIILFFVAVVHLVVLHAIGLSIFYNCTRQTAYKYVIAPLVFLVVAILVLVAFFAL
ncbi:MAG TPA: hypothetical protein VK158_00920 [Acidobacteriota bacterium]|nr:hypothetical protein [Acidobacteriota bacterium]